MIRPPARILLPCFRPSRKTARRDCCSPGSISEKVTSGTRSSSSINCSSRTRATPRRCTAEPRSTTIGATSAKPGRSQPGWSRITPTTSTTSSFWPTSSAPGATTYRQATRLFQWLTVRGAAGLARFGPGTLANIPGQTEPVLTATIRPIGYAGISLSPREEVRLDLTWSRSAVDNTPLSVRLGVIEDRLEGGLRFSLSPRTTLECGYFKASYASESYARPSLVNRGGTVETVTTSRADRDRGRGGSVVLKRNLIRSSRASFDLGYSGLAYGYEGERRKVYLGFFNPRFYQRHLATTRIYGNLRGPLGYDCSAGLGVQQVQQGAGLTRGLIL